MRRFLPLILLSVIVIAACQKEVATPISTPSPTVAPMPASSSTPSLSVTSTPIPSPTSASSTGSTNLTDTIIVPDFSAELAVDVAGLEGIDPSELLAGAEESDIEVDVLPDLEAEVPSQAELADASVDLSDLLGVAGP